MNKFKLLLQKLENLSIDGESFLEQFLEFLLDKSLKGEKQYDILILPTAEILNLRLPLNTTTSALALLQVKLTEKLKQIPPPIINLTNNLKTTKNFHLEEPKLIDQIVEANGSLEENLTIDNQKDQFTQKSELNSHLLVFTDSTNNRSTQEKQFTNFLDTNSQKNNFLIFTEKINSFIEELKNKQNVPLAISLASTDLKTEELNFDNNQLKLSVSSDIYFKQLNLDKNLNWIKEKLVEIFPEFEKLDLIIIKRSSKIPKSQTLELEDSQSFMEKQIESNLSKEEEKEKSQKNSAFYYIYKRYKGNLNSNHALIWNQPLELPQTDLDQFWQQEISDFDLE